MSQTPASASPGVSRPGWQFPGPLSLEEPELLRSLASDLRAADFTADAVAELIGSTAYEQLSLEQLAPGRLALRRLPSSPLATMTAWWLFALPQPAELLAAAFPATGLSGLRRLGLLAASPSLSPSAALEDHDDDASLAPGATPRPAVGLRPAVDLRPHAGDDIGSIWVASDLGTHHLGGPLGHEFVLGIGQASLTLAQAVIRTPVKRALDLGTGCGIQLFHMLDHCEHVTATDISTRALNFTAFNLLLNAEALGLFAENGSCRVRLAEGSLLEPVAGEEFDLIASNPPFVITPRQSVRAGSADDSPSADQTAAQGQAAEEVYTYRDGGLAGDALVEQLIREIPAALAPGGVAQMLGNWEIREGESWETRPRSWIPEGTDAWIIQRERVDTTRYALTWLSDASQSWSSEQLQDALEAYDRDFSSRGVGSVGFGLILLKRPSEDSPAWTGGSLFEEITHPIEQPIGPHLGEALKRRQRRAQAGASSSAMYLAVAEDVTEERHQRPGAEHPGVILARQGAGLRRTALLSSEQAGFLSAADGELTVGQIAGALASILGDPSLAERLEPEILTLFEEGFLCELPPE